VANVREWTDLEREGRFLVERLGGRWSANGGLCRCPAHDDRSPSLSVRAGRSRLLLHCFAGCTASDILKALASGRMLDPGAPVPAGPAPVPDRWEMQAAARRLWGAARELTATPAARYLALRGLAEVSPELRYHPRTPHGAKPFTQFRPALVAAVRDESGLVAVHRTFLEVGRGRVASRPLARGGLGRFGRGAVRLGGVAARLGLAEGIETALSATALFGMPCWATLGTERFALIALPPEATELHLFLDNDPGGRRAEALACAAYGKALPIEVHFPRRAGDDWNDVLQALRAEPAESG